jgi:hypothetical protein
LGWGITLFQWEYNYSIALELMALHGIITNIITSPVKGVAAILILGNILIFFPLS